MATLPELARSTLSSGTLRRMLEGRVIGHESLRYGAEFCPTLTDNGPGGMDGAGPAWPTIGDMAGPASKIATATPAQATSTAIVTIHPGRRQNLFLLPIAWIIPHVCRYVICMAPANLACY